jgi:hypothetical protein
MPACQRAHEIEDRVAREGRRVGADPGISGRITDEGLLASMCAEQSSFHTCLFALEVRDVEHSRERH